MVTDNSKTHINPADYFAPGVKGPKQSLKSKYFFPGSLVGLYSVSWLMYLKYMKRLPLMTSKF